VTHGRNLPDILALFDAEQRRDVVYADAVREVTPNVVRHTSRRGGRGFILYWKLNDAEVEGVAREQIAHYASAGQDFEWKVYAHDAPSGLGQQLVSLGFTSEPEETVVCLDLNALPDTLRAISTSTVEKVVDPAVVDEVIALKQMDSPEDFSDLALSLKEQLREDSAHFGLYVMRAEGKVASAGWARFDENSSFASLWGGSTAPTWRNRGFYRALVAARALEAARRGYAYLTVDALPTSRPILERLGFRVLSRARGYVWSASRKQEAPEGASKDSGRQLNI
jgi:hypothetical protein